MTTTPNNLLPKVDDNEIIPIAETPITSITPENTEEIVSEDEPLNQNIFIPLLDFPIPESGLRSIEATYRFGSTLFGERIPHDGVEILNPLGTPVLAAKDGIVYFSGNDRSKKWGRFTNFYGNFIIIQHQINEISQPIFTLYAHLSEFLVQEGDAVSSGQTIGLVGATGKAFTNHLHFEVRVGDILLQNARNPELYLPLIPTEDQPEMGILIGSLITQNGNPIPGVSVVIQRVLDGEVQPGSALYVETYAKVISGDQDWQENFVASNLPIGDYRVSAYAYQYFVEKFIEIKPNEFVYVTLQPEE
ncbi:MAG: peptidoglycan DD-metalloendopeptidase family protein [Anaerolineaceae bacterium]|nr:peptidoglycan DD-metalloendopeptidase family protein [Anaerolineaceae bacterium]